MEINYMYKLLTNMPLLQGINGIDLARLESKVQMDFVHYTENNGLFIKQEAKCQDLMFLATGEICRHFEHPNNLFQYTEYISAPHVIEPESLFGLRPQYKSSYKAAKECDILTIRKGDVIHTLMLNDVFRINYLNMLSANIHKLNMQLLRCKKSDTNTKIKQFLKSIAVSPTGEKTLCIKMTVLADMIDETRLNVSRALNEMESAGLVSLHRKEIIISDLNSL